MVKNCFICNKEFETINPLTKTCCPVCSKLYNKHILN